MKYDLDVSLVDGNTSHAQVLDLIGTGHRVLDVGCSTGGLARVLRTRSNTVSGIELDPEAARVAEPELDQLVVGDIESMDLLAHFSAGSFDVVVFADVLEHLRDPLKVLRDSVALLAPGGSVVVSLPNVAHGSVRLALLEGRFEYRPLGLLDDTHLRFFTRRSVEELLASAGLLAIDMRRTTADAFATEIPLAPENFSADVVARVRSQPDSDTYQFVFKAIPAAGEARSELAAELIARNEELQSLRAQVGEILGATRGVGPEHRVGLLVRDDPGADRAWASLRAAVTSLEIRRRLDGISLVHMRAEDQSQPATWRGEPVVALGPPDEATADLVADAYDALLVADGGALLTAEPLIIALGDRGCPVLPVAVSGCDVDKVAETVRSGTLRAGPESSTERRGPLTAVPDPLVLASRVVGGDALPLRRQYLTLSGRLPLNGDYLLVASSRADAGSAGPLGRVVVEMASSLNVDVVLVAAPSSDRSGSGLTWLAEAIPGASVLDDAGETDLLSLVDGARMVVTDAAAPAALAVGLKRPVLTYGDSEELADLAAWCGDPDLVAATPAELLARVQLAVERAEDHRLLQRVQAPLEMSYDDLAAAVTGAAARQLALSITEILRLQTMRISALDQANLSLQNRMVHERNALAAKVAQLTAEAQSSRTSVLQRQVREMRQQLDEATSGRAEAEQRLADTHAHAAHLEHTLEALMTTKTMRLLSPGRRLYGRIRQQSR